MLCLCGRKSALGKAVLCLCFAALSYSAAVHHTAMPRPSCSSLSYAIAKLIPALPQLCRSLPCPCRSRLCFAFALSAQVIAGLCHCFASQFLAIAMQVNSRPFLCRARRFPASPCLCKACPFHSQPCHRRANRLKSWLCRRPAIRCYSFAQILYAMPWLHFVAAADTASCTNLIRSALGIVTNVPRLYATSSPGLILYVQLAPQALFSLSRSATNPNGT